MSVENQKHDKIRYIKDPKFESKIDSLLQKMKGFNPNSTRGRQNSPPPCSFLGAVQKPYMLSMFKLYVNSCYISVVTPKF